MVNAFLRHPSEPSLFFQTVDTRSQGYQVPANFVTASGTRKTEVNLAHAVKTTGAS